MSSSTESGKIDKTRMSVPTEGSFSHVGHMGYDPEKDFVSSGVDPSWNTFLTDLESHVIDPQLINQNMDFIKDFVRDAQKAAAATPAPSASAPKKKKQSPPAPRRNVARHEHQGSTSSVTGTTAPPPPAPSSRPAPPPSQLAPPPTAPAPPPPPA